MRAYIGAVIFISAWHVYFSILKKETPLSIPFLILLISPFITYIWKEVSNVKLGKDGFEVQRLKQDVERTIQRAIHGRGIDPNALDDLFKTVELNAWITLVLARMLMRQGLVSLVPDHGLGPSPSLNKLIPLCFSRNLISTQEQDDLEKLRNITFYAEWWDGTKPTYSDWEWALSNCKRIIRDLFGKQTIT